MGRTNILAENATLSQAQTVKNSSYIIPGVYDLSTEDTNWVLTSAFIIFTMQTGKRSQIDGTIRILNSDLCV